MPTSDMSDQQKALYWEAEAASARTQSCIYMTSLLLVMLILVLTIAFMAFHRTRVC